MKTHKYPPSPYIPSFQGRVGEGLNIKNNETTNYLNNIGSVGFSASLCTKDKRFGRLSHYPRAFHIGKSNQQLFLGTTSRDLAQRYHPLGFQQV